jgi:hypothetical protein
MVQETRIAEAALAKLIAMSAKITISITAGDNAFGLAGRNTLPLMQTLT